MNRRSFLKGLAAATASAFIVPEIIVAEEPVKRFWALGGLPEGTMIVPSRMPGDDTAFVQWHIDNDLLLPSGEYDTHHPPIIRSKRGQTVDGSGTLIRLHGNHEACIIGQNNEDCIVTGFHMVAVDRVEYAFMDRSPLLAFSA